MSVITNWLYVTPVDDSEDSQNNTGMYQVPSAQSFTDMGASWPQSCFKLYNGSYQDNWVEYGRNNELRKLDSAECDVCETTKQFESQQLPPHPPTTTPLHILTNEETSPKTQEICPERASLKIKMRSIQKRMVDFCVGPRRDIKNVYILGALVVNIGVGLYLVNSLKVEQHQLNLIASHILDMKVSEALPSILSNYPNQCEYIGLKTKLQMFFTHLHK